MAEPTARREVFGLLAEFNRADSLVESVRRTRKAGFCRIDAYSPFPIEGLAEEMGFKDRRVAWLTLTGGILGAAVGYGMQVYTNHAFPIDIGNRPLVAPPAFMLITFELMVLFAVSFAIFGMLALNHLPRLHHPLFDVPSFHLASADKFFLVVFSNDPKFDRERTRAFLRSLKPVRIDVVEQTEEPE
jgi:hypothetical protein